MWQADTKTMNPTVPDRDIQRLYKRDPARAAAEYGAQFRTDIESFVPLEVVESCTPPGRHELGPISSHHYRAFTDPAGGSGADSFTLAIAHTEEDTTVVDAVREWKPRFSPEQVIEECAALLKSYGISRVTGDRYAGEFPREQFRKHGISYDVAAHSKFDIYRDLLPFLNSGHVVLLDNPTLTVQLTSLERRMARGGRASVDHPPGGHDDVANAVAGVVVESKHSKRRRATWGTPLAESLIKEVTKWHGA